MSIQFKFTSELYHARQRMELTQAQAAEKLDISKRWFQAIEKGDRLPSPKLLLKIFAIFEINGKNIKEEI